MGDKRLLSYAELNKHAAPIKTLNIYLDARYTLNDIPNNHVMW